VSLRLKLTMVANSFGCCGGGGSGGGGGDGDEKKKLMGHKVTKSSFTASSSSKYADVSVDDPEFWAKASCTGLRAKVATCALASAVVQSPYVAQNG